MSVRKIVTAKVPCEEAEIVASTAAAHDGAKVAVPIRHAHTRTGKHLVTVFVTA